MSYTVKQIQEWTQAKVLGDKQVEVDTLILDSRKLLIPDRCMFVCIQGARHDGHHYIADLYKKGVRIFMVSELTDVINDIPGATLIVVNNTLTALQTLATRHRKNFQIPVVGITGSNGKTVVKEWLASTLSAQLNIVRNPKSYNSQVGVPLSVWLINEQSEMGIFEAGISQKNEMKLLQQIIKPTHGIFTNIGMAHQENFSDLKEKIDEKLNLFADADFLIYCRDHEEVHSSIISNDKLTNCTLVTWSQEDKDSYCFVEKIEVQDKKTKISCHIKKEEPIEVTIPFSDKANIENALHVLTFLLHENFPDSLIVEGMKSLPVVAMRLEQVNGKKGSVILNDAYNSDINSLQIAIDNLGYINKSRSCIILSDILQSGLSGDELYKNVSEMVRKSKIGELFAIGPEISKYQHLFKNTKSRFFESTYHFLDYVSEIDFSQSTILIKGARRFHFEQIVAHLEEKIHQTVLEINLENLVYNLNYFRSLLNPETLIMVMVKALTYGSGGKEIASVLQHQKVDYLGVAFADEGAELRRAGINLPIMVLSPSENSFRQIIEYELEPEIYSFEILEEFSKVVSRLQLTEYPVHIKVDTGMHRLGFIEEEYDQLIEVLKNNKNIFIRSVFSHLAVSDNEKEDAFTLQQIELFENITNRIAETVGYVPRKHILNSAGIERFRTAHFDMVRLGIGLHGISSVGKQLKSVSRLRTVVSQIKKIKKGDTIGYNRRGKADHDMKIAILPIGYADGLNRKFGNGNGSVVISGETYPFIGDICMDMCMVDISKAQNVQQGDMVVVFGPERPVSLLAKELDTIPYEILTSISQRVKRIYYHG